ncbi:GNAT family N-acetyltransferase [Moritella sp. 24]|uniref:GNAT family N-acetyltransferase n=1 Tax=Moritella sp. 24 TaxID=2746230 RepID=UPI001BA6AE42|nr:GNAT family N-acetyltransferase [Moritella sp. 24]QUM76239.1 GNAT family N-acetyltransferase [Moritella sp. 24]
MNIINKSLNLRRLTKDSFYEVCLLSVKSTQEHHVDSNAISIAEASFSKHAWFKGIYLGDVAVGFVMVDVNPQDNKYYLWRFMIDAKYQGKGLGKRSIQLLLSELKTQFNATEITTSVITDEIGPLTFYQDLGFKLTGNYIEGREPELSLYF